MTVQQAHWEIRSLALAHEALGHSVPNHAPTFAPGLLESSFRHCDEVTAAHSRTFYLASALLPSPEQRAMRTLYAFCRTTDDTVDNATDDPRAALADWRQRSLSASPDPEDRVVVAWSDTRARFGIPTRYAEQLIDGVARDLTVSRYETFGQLADYCYGVASTVGLMAMHITGFSGPQAVPDAVRLGVALQFTNILRDVAEDWAMGRLYLPLEELDDFGLGEADIQAGVVTDRWRARRAGRPPAHREPVRQTEENGVVASCQGRPTPLSACSHIRSVAKSVTVPSPLSTNAFSP